MRRSPIQRLTPVLKRSATAYRQASGPVPGVGYGIAQWTTSSRQAGLETLAKKDRVGVSNFGAQLEYVVQELHGTEHSRNLQRARTVEEATIMIDSIMRFLDYTEVGLMHHQARRIGAGLIREGDFCAIWTFET